MKHYNQTTAPSFPLADIKIPIAYMYGSSDGLADPKGVEWSANILNKSGSLIFMKEYDFGHLSFAIAKDMNYTKTDVIPLLPKV
jgi:hypothetical protein